MTIAAILRPLWEKVAEGAARGRMRGASTLRKVFAYTPHPAASPPPSPTRGEGSPSNVYIPSNFRTAASVALFALLLVACGQSETANKTEAPPNAQAIADRTIGPDGAGGIAAALPFTQAAITEAAVGYAVAQAQDQIEGDPYPKFTLSIGEEVVFDVLPTADRANVHAVVTHSSFAVGPEAEMMGATFGSAPAAQVLYCLTPEQHAAYDFSCSSAADGQFWRGYDLPADYQGARAPFTAIDPDVATQATLVEMSWIAPRP